MSIPLSKRLKVLAKEISPASYFADIGSDHAYLPCYVCINDVSARAIAGEVAEGPFNRAKETVENYELTERIDVRLGDGLSVINLGDAVKEIVIAGMGGALISSILKNGKKRQKLKTIDKMILQPNNNEHRVRKVLLELQFTLTKELIVEDNGLIYEILVAERNEKVKSPYKDFILEKQLLFGPYLLRDKSPLFIKKWQEEKVKLLNILHEIKRSDNKELADRIATFEKKLSWIEEAIS